MLSRRTHTHPDAFRTTFAAIGILAALILAKPAFDPLLAAAPDDADDADEEDLLLLAQRTQRARELLISLDCSQPMQYSFMSRYWVKPRQPSFILPSHSGALL